MARIGINLFKAERKIFWCQQFPKSAPKNYRKGYSKKTVKTQFGEIEINISRDRNSKYEPQIIGKYSRNADGMEKILSLYAAGMSIGDISEQIKGLYYVEISPIILIAHIAKTQFET